MTRQRYADVVRRLVQRVRTEPPPSLPNDRRRLVSAVEQALRARARRRTAVRRAAFLVPLSVAAVLALVVTVRHPRNHAADVAAVAHDSGARGLTVLGADRGEVIIGNTKAVPLRSGMTLGAGLRLVAPATGEVRVGTPEGTELTLEPRGDLAVTEASATRRFALHAGAVRAHVARLFAGERFIIDTPDAEVEVHGTIFRVAVVEGDPGCGAGVATRVSVSEGVVSVRAGGHEVTVGPGATWPSDCRARAVAETHVVRPPKGHALVPHAEQAPPTEAPVAVVAEPATVPTPAAPPSSLAAQNDLFAAAVDAKNRGEPQTAVRLFTKLLDEHPESPLAEGAAVQRMKLLSTFDDRAAARAASDYLRRFPDGYARADAQRLTPRTMP